MDNDIPEINELIQQFSKLPGLGPKSAKRIILFADLGPSPGNLENCWINSFISGISLSIRREV